MLGVVEQHALLGQLHLVDRLELVIEPRACVHGAGAVQLGRFVVEARRRGVEIVELVAAVSFTSSRSLIAASAYDGSPGLPLSRRCAL